MIRSTLLFVICLIAHCSLFSQPCSFILRDSFIRGISVLAGVNANGKLFSNGTAPLFIPHFKEGAGDQPNTVYYAGLWVGGVRGVEKKVKTTTSGLINSTVAPGPVNVASGSAFPENCNDWNRVFKVRGSDVGLFLADLNMQQSAQTLLAKYPTIFGWPGIGNPYFHSVSGFDLPTNSQYLAPFEDVNLDGIFNPMDGDFPCVRLDGKPGFVPYETAWVVYNDIEQVNDSGIGVEIQQTVWTIDCPSLPLLNNTVFTSHKIINRSEAPIDSVFAGLAGDFDLGCYQDDYFGCNPDLNCYFIYNQDSVDNNQDCVFPFFPDSLPLPVQSVVFLDRPLDKFMYMNTNYPGPGATPQPDGTKVPFSNNTGSYNYLTGSWLDGRPLTFGGIGYDSTGGTPVDFVFPGDPSDPNGWSACTENLGYSERVLMGSAAFGTILPGESIQLTAAWTAHFFDENYLPCGVSNTFSEVEDIRNLYNGGFSNGCVSLVGVTEDAEYGEVRVYPNPAKQSARIEYENVQVSEIRIYSINGSLVKMIKNPASGTCRIDLADFEAGVYSALVLTEKGIRALKMMVIK